VKNRKWDAKTKAMVVLQGLKGKPVVEICQEHQICHLNIIDGAISFWAIWIRFRRQEKVTEKLNNENKHLRKIIGDLTVELKKTEELLK